MKTLQFELLTTLEDGTPVSLNKYEIGGVIQIVDADGNKSSAPDGDYTFQDGSIATVTGGIITELAPATQDETPESMASEPAPSPDAPATDEDTATDTEDDSDDKELITQIKSLLDAITKLQSEFDSLNATTADMKKEFEKEKELNSEKFNKVSGKSILETENKPKKESYSEMMFSKLKAINGLV